MNETFSTQMWIFYENTEEADGNFEKSNTLDSIEDSHDMSL